MKKLISSLGLIVFSLGIFTSAAAGTWCHFTFYDLSDSPAALYFTNCTNCSTIQAPAHGQTSGTIGQRDGYGWELTIKTATSYCNTFAQANLNFVVYQDYLNQCHTVITGPCQ